jgi:DNA polymerase-3 subunit beta
MQVVVSKKDLIRILARSQGVADKKGTMPVLGNVLIRATDNALVCSATDLYLAVRGRIEAEVKAEGTVAVGARDIFDRVKMMPDGQVSISVKDGTITTVQAVGSARRFTLHGMPGDDFPVLPSPESKEKELTLPVSIVERLISATHFSISTDETRLHLNSALFEWDEKCVRMVTTDGHRLSKLEIEVETGLSPSSMLIPLKGIMELKRLCEEALSGDGADPTLTLSQSGPNAFVSVAGFDFSAKLVDAQFPPYERVIPESSGRAVRAPRAAVTDAIKAVSLAASDRTGGVKLVLSAGKLRFESESSEGGQAFDDVPVDYQGDEVTLGFSAKYFLDAAGAMDAEELLIGISGELDPAVLRPGTDRTGSNYVAVVMPMRI